MKMKITAGEIISTFDSLIPNVYTFERKCEWLGLCDGLISLMYHHLHTPDGSAQVDVSSYNSPDKELMLDAEWRDIYLDYLAQKIHYYNREYQNANNAAHSFNNNLSLYHNRLRGKQMPDKKDRIENIWR